MDLIWRATPISETPEIVLSRWVVKELPNGDRHFVGYNETEQEGRVSSRIVEFDKESMKGRTRSGRVYHLVGPPSIDSEGAFVWLFWRQNNRVSGEIDITEF